MPCLLRGKKYEVLGMKPENAPPPMPASAARQSSHQKGVSGLPTAWAHPMSGRTRSRVVIVTSLRVPMRGGSTIHTSRRVPPASPGMAVSQ